MTDESLETQIAVLENEVEAMTETLKNHVRDQKEVNKIIFKKLDALDTKLDNKYAGKWVEKAQIAVLISAVAAIVGFIVRGGK